MSQMQIQILALILLLVPLPLISIGTTADIPALWWTGLAILALGGLIPVVMRFVPAGEESGGDGEEG